MATTPREGTDPAAHPGGCRPPGRPLPGSRCVPLELAVGTLLLHEETEHDRLADLLLDVAQRGVTTRIHATPTDAGMMVLDGAHRTSAASVLGLPAVPGHLVRVPPTYVAPGWALAVPRETAERVLATDVPSGTVVALVHLGDSAPIPVRARAAHHGEGHVEAIQALGSLTHAGHYRRMDPAADHRSVRGAVLEWRLPNWSQLSRAVSEVGPLPAGVTRFAPLLDGLCPDAHGRHATGAVAAVTHPG